MDFTNQFESLFQKPIDYISQDVSLGTKLQETRSALQESLSEIESLGELIKLLYKEAMVETVATGELVSQIKSPPYQAIALPRNADNASLSEQAGYVMYCMKFHGFATRRTTEDLHNTKEHRDSLKKTVEAQTVKVEVKRTGAIRMPELAGMKEMKRSVETAAPPSPPATPPKQDKGSSSKSPTKK
ncbi:hypothetical protein QK701_sRNA3gp1 [Grapevine associated cogu-like virus 4]|uniref:Uncharacterized protein n=1 Tax=Grapevine associated cogu-like virus 4 TaxID=2755145 RepID=A0A7D7J3I1_9VIRU|nr:hypothetical protein QK701_sRNA3gp1 [Grapevine associated cogu-like virus 4]QMP81966.1 hypothetical protein [Grapevine associated cogu-like virus 4]